MKKTKIFSITTAVCLGLLCAPPVLAQENQEYRARECFDYRFAKIELRLLCAPGREYMLPYTADVFRLFAIALEKVGFSPSACAPGEKTDITIILDEVRFNDFQQLEIPISAFNKKTETLARFKLLDNHGIENILFLTEFIKNIFWEEVSF